jgi:putative Mn2+ efflux pump MntP
MTRAIVGICTFILSSLGWWAGSGIGLFTAFALSMVGTGVGIYFGKQLAERWGA